MNLTGKANDDFNTYLCNKSSEEGYFWDTLYEDQDIYGLFEKLPPVCQKSLIIQWLNTLQYKGENLFLSVFEKSFAIKSDFMSFDDITNQTIEVCNKIYNQSKE